MLKEITPCFVLLTEIRKNMWMRSSNIVPYIMPFMPHICLKQFNRHLIVAQEDCCAGSQEQWYECANCFFWTVMWTEILCLQTTLFAATFCRRLWPMKDICRVNSAMVEDWPCWDRVRFSTAVHTDRLLHSVLWAMWCGVDVCKQNTTVCIPTEVIHNKMTLNN
jgi:hypothetical protein